MTYKCFFSVIFTIILSSYGFSYTPTLEWEKGHGSDIGDYSSIIVDDIDEDGNNELIMGNSEGFVHIMGYQSGVYLDEWKSSHLGTQTHGIATGDVDEDSQKELLIGTYDGYLYIFGYNGVDYTLEWESGYVTRNMYGIAVGDVDNDGKNEIVFGGWEGYVYVYEWNGATYVQKWQSSDIGTYVLDVTIGDTDEDGINEIVVGSGFSDKIYVFGWDGATFQEEWQSASLSSQTYGVAVGDVDGDFAPEIVATTLWGNVYVFSYVGPGNYNQDWVSPDMGSYLYKPAIGDVDDDGTAEFLIGNSNGFVYIFSYSGVNYNLEHTIGTAGSYLCPSVGDCDNDTNIEIVTGCAEGAIIIYGHSGGGYVEEWLSDDLGTDIFGVSGGDIDGDNTNELLIGTGKAYTGFPLYVYGHNGTGYIEDWQGNLGPNAWGIDVGNLDDDTLLEFACGNQQHFTYIYSYDGAGYSQEWQSANLNSYVYAIAIGDVDNDTTKELVAAEMSGVLDVWGWDGVNYLLEFQSPVNAVGMDIYGIEVADVNPGGVKEIVIVDGVARTLRVWHYTGATYTEEWNSGSLASTLYGLDVGDIDGDGDIEMVCGDGGGNIYVYGWNGASYGQEWTTNTGIDITGISIGDVDADGEEEFIAAGCSFGSFIVYGYNGAGYQIESEVDSFCPEMGLFNGMKIMDFDNDGSKELAVGASGYFFIFGFPDSTPPSVTVTSPNGGEVLTPGDTFDITWLARDYASVDSIDILYSTDNGGTWSNIETGEPNDSIYSWIVPNTPSDSCLAKVIAYDPSINTGEDISDSLFAIIGGGIEKDVDLSYKPFFCYSYPEPCNDAIKILYQLPTASKVVLRLFDSSGREIKKLVDDAQKPGIHTILYSNRSLPSGIYFYKIRAGRFCYSDKITLIR